MARVRDRIATIDGSLQNAQVEIHAVMMIAMSQQFSAGMHLTYHRA